MQTRRRLRQIIYNIKYVNPRYAKSFKPYPFGARQANGKYPKLAEGQHLTPAQLEEWIVASRRPGSEVGFQSWSTWNMMVNPACFFSMMTTKPWM